MNLYQTVVFTKGGEWIDTLLTFDTPAQQEHARVILRAAGRRCCDLPPAEGVHVTSLTEMFEAFNRDGGEDVAEVIEEMLATPEGDDATFGEAESLGEVVDQLIAGAGVVYVNIVAIGTNDTDPGDGESAEVFTMDGEKVSA